MATQEADDHLAAATAVLARIADNVERVIRGKRDVVELVLLCLVAEGHLLVEDVPGVGKTSLAKALARSLDVSFGRIQFTPDLLPSDVVGVSVFNRESQEFSFRPGPVFADVVLADEINRASPKTQSALLEAMAEEQVTVDGVTYPLRRPFVVIATQNPIEHEGTYALPESQLDRFLMRTAIGYPSPEAELDLLEHQTDAPALNDLAPVADAADLAALVRAAASVHVAPPLRRYLVDLADASRRHPDLGLGMSPRATLSLLRVSRVRALSAGRSFATPDDVKALVRPVLAHRLTTSGDARLRGVSTEDVLGELVDTVPIPRAPRSRLLTRAGWGVLLAGGVALLGGWLFGLPELLVLGTTLLVLVGACAAMTMLTSLRLEVVRTLHPDRVHAGSASRVEVLVRNRGRRRTPVLTLRDGVTGTAGAELLLAPLERNGRVRGRPTACPPAGAASSPSAPWRSSWATRSA